MHSARVSIGNTSLAVRYAALAPAEAFDVHAFLPRLRPLVGDPSVEPL